MTGNWALKRTVDPTSEPITPADMADHARISVSDDDQWMLRAIRAAREFTENVQWRTLVSSTWRLTLDQFPSWEIKLPMPPLVSVSSITYLDTAGTTQTMSSSLYVVDTDAEPGRLTPAYSTIWPVTRYQIASVKVTYTAGYSSATAIPASTIMPLMQLAADMYEHREYTAEAAYKYSPQAVAMLESNRVIDFSGPLGASC